MKIRGNMVKKNVSLYLEQKNSYLVTEIMNIYTATDNDFIKIKCLELLNKIDG